MGFYDAFRSQSATSAPAPAPSPAPSPSPGPTGNSAVPANQPNPDGKMVGTDQTPPNPLDNYKDLFTIKVDEKAPVAPTFNLPADVIAKAAKQQDFTKGASPELMARVNAGDAAAITELINFSNQAAYQAAISHATSLTDQFVNARLSFDKTTLSKDVKRELTQSAIGNSPNFQHPVVKAELTRVCDAMQAQNPDASPQQIVDSAKKYLSDLMQGMNPESQAAADKARQAEGTNWDQWIETGKI